MILVTGATGTIGSRVVSDLVATGIAIRAMRAALGSCVCWVRGVVRSPRERVRTTRLTKVFVDNTFVRRATLWLT